jgi:deubiquitinase DESI2
MFSDLSPVNEFIQPFGLGVFHTGVVINGKEYTYAGGAGIFDHTPQEPGEQAKYRESVNLGVFEGNPSALNDAIYTLGKQFGPNGYNIMTQNCNHFADALSQLLLKRSIPGSFVAAESRDNVPFHRTFLCRLH